MLLSRGHRLCFLFTDLANPTSNGIYQRVGNEPVCDVDGYAFA
jgi:predicted GNAT family acetyltransferase